MESPTIRIGVREAKTHLSRLGRLAWEGREVVICRYGKPFLRLTPVTPAGEEPRERKPRRLGSLEGRIWVAPDFDETPDEVIRLFEGRE